MTGNHYLCGNAGRDTLCGSLSDDVATFYAWLWDTPLPQYSVVERVMRSMIQI